MTPLRPRVAAALALPTKLVVMAECSRALQSKANSETNHGLAEARGFESQWGRPNIGGSARATLLPRKLPRSRERVVTGIWSWAFLDKPDRSFRKIRHEIIKDPVPAPTRPDVSGIAHQRRHLTSRAPRCSKDLGNFLKWRPWPCLASSPILFNLSPLPKS
jgi:hypothetical protein